MNGDVIIAAHPLIWPNINKMPLFCWVLYQYLVDLCWHCSYKHCGKVLWTWV